MRSTVEGRSSASRVPLPPPLRGGPLPRFAGMDQVYAPRERSLVVVITCSPPCPALTAAQDRE